jgi:NADPH:quinone reductase-like Zn-dependent oxidoreductase
MKAFVQESYGSPDGLKLRDVEKPGVGDDDVLVRVFAASVNAYDWHMMKRLPQFIGMLLRMPRSRFRGADLAGRVEAVGRNVTRFKPGDEVFGAGIGSFAEYATSTERRLAPKPRNLTFEQAATLACAGLTALQGLRDKGCLQPGQRVLIYGAGGGVGTFAVQIAKALGAHVTAVSSTKNAELLRSIGADEVIDYTKEDFTKRGERYDILFDVGAGRSIADCRSVLAPNGILMLIGAGDGLWPVLSRLLEAQIRSRIGKQRIPSFMARGKHEDLVALKDLAEAGKLSPVVDRTYPLSEVPDALRYVGTRGARGKVVIKVARAVDSEGA